MKAAKFTLKASAVLAVALFCAAQARAQAIRTWVSGTGDDLNPCSRTAPCKTFAGAISKTATDGEIDVLDPGTFGTVTITKSITINGTGARSVIGNSGTVGVTVNATTTSVVIIRDIAILGADTGDNGVRVLTAKTVQVDHCWIYDQEGNGIEVAATNNVNLLVNDTVITDCALDGVHVSTTTGQALVALDNCRIQDTGSDGVEAVDNVRMAVRNCVLTQNLSTGIRTSGTNSQLNVEQVFVSYSGTGIQASAGSNIRVSDSVIAQNATGVSANGGTVDSFQGNSFLGNTSNGSFSSTTLKL
jgi:hypothetical protein